MKIVELGINEIKPYKNNPRINDYAIDKVAESIKRYGFKQPLVLDKDNIIVVGHTRFEAAKKLGYNELPCVIADDLTDDQIKQYRLVDNKVAEYSNWDYSLLNLELSEISDDLTDFDFPDFSMEEDPTPDELDVLLEDSLVASAHDRLKPREPSPPTIPAAVIEEELPSETEINSITYNVLCKDETEEKLFLDFLNKKCIMYTKVEMF